MTVAHRKGGDGRALCGRAVTARTALAPIPECRRCRRAFHRQLLERAARNLNRWPAELAERWHGGMGVPRHLHGIQRAIVLALLERAGATVDEAVAVLGELESGRQHGLRFAAVRRDVQDAAAMLADASGVPGQTAEALRGERRRRARLARTARNAA